MRFARTGVQVAALAVVGATALAACGKSTVSGNAAPKGYAGIPTASAKKVSGGTVTFGMPAGATPTWIFPITPGANSSVYTISFFQNLMYRPVYWGPNGDSLEYNYAESLASAPKFSNGNKTITITMKSNYKWSNGTAVNADGVKLYTNLVQAAVAENPSNFGNFSPGFWPSNVASMQVTSPYTFVINLTKADNPSDTLYNELGLMYSVPAAWDVTKYGNAPDSGGCLNDSAADKWAKCKAVYNYLSKQSGDLSTYATNPLWQIVDGPFKLSQFNASTDANTMVPNPAYTGPNKPTIAKFQEVAYTSDDAEYNALRSGQLTVGLVPSNDLPQVPTLKKSGFNVFGAPDFGFDYMYFNFANTTNHWNSVIGQLYIRQALAHLVDNAGYIKSVYHGYAVPANGPIPPQPKSPFTPANATSTIYSYSIPAAESLLAKHGWKNEGGTQTCVKPGTAADECGANIPSGFKLTITLNYDSQSPAVTAETTAYASAAKAAGIPITLKGGTFNQIVGQEDNPASKSTINSWQMADFGGFTAGYYPTTNEIFNIGGSYNLGSFNDAKATALINASVYGSDPSALSAEASYMATNLPGLFQAESDHVYAWSTKLSGSQGSFWEIPQFTINPEEWYFTSK
jgi:peptide/nickel transport system substrate-binding protein